MAEINWKLNIGDNLIDYQKDGSMHRNLTVINRKIVEGANRYKYYQCQCNLCGQQTQWIRENSLIGRKQGCSQCRQPAWKYEIGDNIKAYDKNGKIIADFIITNRENRLKQVTSKKSKHGYENCNLRYYEYKCNICGAEHLWKPETKVETRICACCAGVTKIRGINTFGDLYPECLIYFDEDDAFNPNLQWHDKYNAKCPKCGNRQMVEVSNLIQRKSLHCNHCNSFAVKHPELVQFLANPTDGQLPAAYNEHVLTKCPDCGHEKYMQMCNLSFQGYSCEKCGDGVSRAEKIMMSVLTQLNVDFVYQLTQKHLSWCKKYKYDFYIPSQNTIIETHGCQHYEESFGRCGGMTLQETQLNDKRKEELAKQNGISNYIVINCRDFNIDFIKNSITQSHLSQLYDLSVINWSECVMCALSSIVKQVCIDWEQNHSSVKELTKKYDLSHKSIVRYLRIGTSLGWCCYDPNRDNNMPKKRTRVIKDGKTIALYESLGALSRASLDIFGKHLAIPTLSIICNKRNGQYQEFVIQFVN